MAIAYSEHNHHSRKLLNWERWRYSARMNRNILQHQIHIHEQWPAEKITRLLQHLVKGNSQINNLGFGRGTATLQVRPPPIGGNVPSHESQRALDFMRCMLPEQRRCARVHLPIQATLVFHELGSEPQIGFLRDMNKLGAFCYCSQKPNVGDHAQLTFAFPDDEQMRANCEGVVVRVEELAPGAAIGVAIEFTRYEVTQPQKIEQPEPHSDEAPFIGWTVDMVERMFTKAQRSMRPNSECTQAA